MTFEWDENKNSENIQKHKVSFEKAQDGGRGLVARKRAVYPALEDGTGSGDHDSRVKDGKAHEDDGQRRPHGAQDDDEDEKDEMGRKGQKHVTRVGRRPPETHRKTLTPAIASALPIASFHSFSGSFQV